MMFKFSSMVDFLFPCCFAMNTQTRIEFTVLQGMTYVVCKDKRLVALSFS